MKINLITQIELETHAKLQSFVEKENKTKTETVDAAIKKYIDEWNNKINEEM